MATPIVKRPWPAAFIRTALSSSSYALGAALKLFPALALSLYAAIGGAVALITFTVEYYGNIKPAQEFEEVAPRSDGRLHFAFHGFCERDGNKRALKCHVAR
jgi:hypothetical protein